MEKNEKIMHLEKICKSYNNDKIRVLKDINLDFYCNNFYAIMGSSGSGKSTLINILGNLDTFDSGEYILYQTNTKKLNDKELSTLRMKNIGFIFQGIHLDPNLKAYENVMVPMLINKDIERKEKKTKALRLLESVGLGERVNHFPRELSGGEQQRVAIARALANDPQVILADEPTGNLDKKNEQEIFKKLKELSQNGKCVIVVSHSDNVKDYADIIYYIEAGEMVGVVK